MEAFLNECPCQRCDVDDHRDGEDKLAAGVLVFNKPTWVE